jgi:hypothetical protein
MVSGSFVARRLGRKIQNCREVKYTYPGASPGEDELLPGKVALTPLFFARRRSFSELCKPFRVGWQSTQG